MFSGRRSIVSTLAAALAVAVLVVPFFPSRSDADLWDRVTDGFSTQRVRRTYYDSGQSLVGGLVPTYPHVIERRQNEFQISTPCGSFSLTGSGILDNLREMLDPDVLIDSLSRAIQDSIQNLVGAAISKLSMMTVCYAVPTLCDLVKHMQATAAGLHNIRALSCQELQGAVGSLAESFGQGRQARCMARQVADGRASLNVAQRVCSSGDWSADRGGFAADPYDDSTASPGSSWQAGDPSTPLPTSGNDRSTQTLVADAIDMAFEKKSQEGTVAAGKAEVTTEERTQLKEFVRRVLGEIVVEDASGVPAGVTTAGGKSDEASALKFQPEAPEERLYDVYVKESEIVNELLDCAVRAIGRQTPGTSPSALPPLPAGVTCAPVNRWPGDGTTGQYALGNAQDILQAVSLPVLPMPHGVLRSLYRFRDLGLGEEYTRHANKVAGNIALMRVLWRTHQARDRLEHAILSSEDMTAAERTQIRVRIDRLDREAQRLVEEKEMAERHLIPALDSVLAAAAERERHAGNALMSAPSDAAIGRQNPLGYGW